MTADRRNSRRRFLAFLGLAGAPAALWAASARAQDTAASSSSSASSLSWTQSIECSDSEETPAYSLSFKNTYQLDGGKLTGDNEPLIGITALPTRATYSPGYSDAGKPTDSTFNTSGATLSFNDDEVFGGITSEFSATLRVPAALTGGRLLDAATGAVLTDVLNVFPSPDDALINNVSGSFDAQSSMLQAPVTLTLELNGQTAATYTYDVSHIDTPSFASRMQAKYAGLTGVTADSTMVYGAPNCNLPVDPTTGGAAPCFFTTATVETLGLSDDCWELRTLRAFRDGPLARMAGGRALTARYYAEAPRLVDGVNRRSDAARVWLCVYWTHILPCAVMARFGLHAAALAHYRRLFGRLERLAA